MYTIQSTLKAWPGEFSLPDPDEFSGLHWKTWKDAVNQPKRESYAKTHTYCYCGLELVEKYGEWKMDIPLKEVRAWENSPEAERIKLVAFIGRELMYYMNGIIDPKG